ncbi:hypothetical protein CHU98_g6520 [Xylaria longipes]|nr:hypothetical protein CHU98_g6520 [Xylaria longipes]
MASTADMRARLPCPACRAIIPNRRQLKNRPNSTLETLFERVDFYPTYPAVASSAQAGCNLCVLMWRRLTSIPPEARELIKDGNGKFVWVSSEQRTRQLDASWDRKVKIQVGFDFLPYGTVSPSGSIRDEEARSPQDGHQYGCAVISMSVRCRPVSGALRFVDGDPWGRETLEFSVFDSIEWRRKLPSSVTLSDENVTKIKHWIDTCLGNHSECANARTATYWIPRRLLEIGDGDHGLDMRLIESSEKELRVGTKFAALSHVWGDISVSPPLRVLSSNYGRLKNGIREFELPKNFADAAHDSLDDWREQAILMHLVYSHALITIVATSAISCHEGFLARNIDSIHSAKVAYSLPGAGEQPGSDDGYMIIYDYDNPHDIWRMFAINGSKWNTRAWTMQERSLSTRLVHFCRNKIFFECRGCLQSEENEPVQEYDTINSTLWPRNTSTSYKELRQHWQLFVGEYTSRNLTVSTDRLPAIQSVAEEMAAVTGQKYIRFSGMWQSNLRHELLWYVSFGKAKRPDAWRAPSWSWAAVEGQISLWQRDFRNSQQSLPNSLLSCLSRHTFQVLEVDQEYPNLRSTNPGFLRVKSLMKRFSRLQKQNGSGQGGSFFPYDLIIDEVCSKNEPGSCMKVFAYGRLDIEDFTDSDISPTTPGMFLYLHVNNDTRATGLILRAKAYDDAGSHHAWTRIGIATLFLDRSEMPILNDAFRRDHTPQVAVLI